LIDVKNVIGKLIYDYIIMEDNIHPKFTLITKILHSNMNFV